MVNARARLATKADVPTIRRIFADFLAMRGLNADDWYISDNKLDWIMASPHNSFFIQSPDKLVRVASRPRDELVEVVWLFPIAEWTDDNLDALAPLLRTALADRLTRSPSHASWPVL